MKLILITLPDFFEGEAGLINLAFKSGIDILHLRKPGASAGDIRHLLNLIDKSHYNRIVLHDCFELCAEYSLMGVHLNKRNPVLPRGYEMYSLSRSCHSIKELVSYIADFGYNYFFLSPIFDSISKQGYSSAFSYDELHRYGEGGIINDRVMALGGVAADNVATVRELGFGGAAVLGYVWSAKGDVDEFSRRVGRIREKM